MRKRHIFYAFLFIILLSGVRNGFAEVSQTIHAHTEKRPCEEGDPSSGDWDQFKALCVHYHNKACRNNSDCGPFPCIQDTCLIQPCQKDQECPNKMRGLHATPVPGFCAIVDVY